MLPDLEVCLYICNGNLSLVRLQSSAELSYSNKLQATLRAHSLAHAHKRLTERYRYLGNTYTQTFCIYGLLLIILEAYSIMSSSYLTRTYRLFIVTTTIFFCIFSFSSLQFLYLFSLGAFELSTDELDIRLCYASTSVLTFFAVSSYLAPICYTLYSSSFLFELYSPPIPVFLFCGVSHIDAGSPPPPCKTDHFHP